MKKHHLSLMAVMTCIFAAFTLGFFLGRNQNHKTVHLTALPVAAEHNRPLETIPGIDASEAQISFPVNINTAGLEELCALPGIGETLARRILAYRDLNGLFDRPEELMNVEGIGSGKLEALLDCITTGG